jgi:hypothetical protein
MLFAWAQNTENAGPVGGSGASARKQQQSGALR